MSPFQLFRSRPLWPVVSVTAVGALTFGFAATAYAGAPVATTSHRSASVPTGPIRTAHRVSTSKFVPTRVAARAGVTPGEAFMGWREGTSAAQRSSAAVRTPLAARTAAGAPSSGVNGIDVSRWQGTVNWHYWKAKGKTFAFVKATEGTSYRNRYFSSQYTGSAAVGLKRGSYHFAIPNGASGAAQASYFVAHGGGWQRDGRTLPGVLDIEYNPYGSTCYGLSHKSMVSWVSSFTRKYRALTGRDAIIYTTADWWNRCTGDSKAFHTTNPLWVARYSSSVGRLPGGWTFYTFWQYTSSPLDSDRFSGKSSRLTVLANG